MKTTLPNSNSRIFQEPIPQLAFTNTRQEVNSLLQGLQDIQKQDKRKVKQTSQPFGWLPSKQSI